ncbi:MAG: 16S rRNA (cytosine(967)-C(5))-methyltransferase RsmB [Arenicellales bacterium]
MAKSNSENDRKRNSPRIQLVAARVLRDVIDQGRSLDRTLEVENARVDLSLRPVLMELAYGGCRRYCFLDGLLSKLLSKPIRKKDRMVHFLLVVGLYQLAYMRMPDHAAVDETVKALGASKQSWARGLVNGVLRAYLRQRDDQSLGKLELQLPAYSVASFPPFLFDAIYECWPEYADSILKASNHKPPMALRVNQQKTTRSEYLALLAAQDIAANPTAESAVGIILDNPISVDRVPMFAEGWVSVQDESAQLCTGEMYLAPGQRVLDACAAPGGKTCAVLEAEPSVKLTAVDLPERIETIKQNLARIGLQAEVSDSGLEEYADWWDGKYYDRILMDVPCSGTGVIRRHPDIRHRRQQGDFERFSAQQLDLLEDAWPMLAANGMLLYATCSIMPAENDEVIRQFIACHCDASVQHIDTIAGINGEYGVQRLPGVHSGDGFYYSRLNKL